MKHKKSLISALAILLTVGIITIMNNDPSPTNSEIPISIVKPTQEAQSKSSVNKTVTPDPISQNRSVTVDSTSSDPTSNETSPSVPTVYFSANSDEYPGSGTFMLPNFTTEPNWSVTFNYTCDTGQVFGVINLGAQNIIMNRTGTFGDFISTAGQIKVVVPADQVCTWDVSVS